MAFDAYNASVSSGSDSKKEVDWNALNEYVVDTCNLQDRETLVGYVSAIVDLGTQKQPDAEYVSDVEDEDAYILEHPDTYFKDGFDDKGKPARMKCYPQKNQQCVAIAVDFPDIMLDKGQFFGESSTKPLRMWMGGQFYTQGNGMIIGRPTPLKVVNLDKERKTKKWSFSPLHLFYKMATAAKIIKAGEQFLPNDIDQLIGKAFQFEVQVYFRNGKDGKQYYTEYIKFVGGLGRGQKEPEILTEPFLVQFKKQNDPALLKEVRSHVLNTIKMAINYQGSSIQKQIEGMGTSQEDDSAVDANLKQQNVVKPSLPKKVEEPEDVFDDDENIPF